MIYDYLAAPAEVLISGCGDSGVIEGLHYAFADFRHEYVTALWRGGKGLEAQIDLGLERARMDHIFQSDDPNVVAPEIQWWLEQRHYMAHNRVPWPPGGEAHLPPIYQRLDELLEPLFAAGGFSEPFESADWETLDKFADGLSVADRLKVRDGVRPLADEWISRLTAELAETIPLPDDIATLTGLSRPNLRITLNGRLPTPYSRHLSPYNVWTMRLLLEFPNVKYRQGGIDSCAPRRLDNRFDVKFADGTQAIFDRVVTRYGPGRRTAAIASPDPAGCQEGVWLLSELQTLVASRKDPDKMSIVDPARQAVLDALDALDARTWTEVDVSKNQYVGRVTLGPERMPHDGGIYDDPCRWLAGELRSARYPRYSMDHRVRMADIRR